MAYQVIDRRKNGKGKSVPNRQKFIRRVKKQVKEAVKEAIRNGNIGDIVSDKGKKVNVPIKDLNEPKFHHGKGGVSDGVMPGNKEFVTGDRFKRPPEGGGGGGGSEGSPDGEGEDSFQFNLTRDEFIDLFFEDLELPDLLRKELATTEEFENRRAGFSTDGNPAQMNVVRTMKQSKARRIGLRSPKKRKLKVLEKEEAQLLSTIKTAQANGDDCTIEKDRLKVVQHDIEVLKRKIKAVPFVDDIDLRYNRWDKHPVPVTQAVMFCVMDVSGSMGEWEKEMSKRFFMLLYMFLFKSYERVEIVFIRHHSEAKEVDEQEFFYSKETGGTLVSPALQMMHDIMEERYPSNAWNVYGCQCSDGDNWPHDNAPAVDTLLKKILPRVQYYAYVEIDRSERSDSDLWPDYETIKAQTQHFDMTRITDAKDIYSVFRRLFEKRM